MTNRSALTRGSRAVLLAAMLGLVVGVLPARAASSVEIEARALVGGRYEVGGWMALAVTLVNEGEPTDGYVTATTEVGAVRRFVEMPAGARKVVMLYVQPEAFQREVQVAYEEPNGTVTARVEVRVLEQSNDQVAVIGDGTGTLRPQLIGSGEFSGPEPIALAAADIPDRPEPLDGLSAIVWAGDSGGLTEAQRRSLERWVADGGRLVVLGGPDWQARASAFVDLLPLENLGGLDAVDQAAIAAWTGDEEPPIESATVSTGDLRPDARALITADDGTILASMRSVGAGRVILIGSDLATNEFRGWAGASRIWSRLLPTNALLEQFMGGGFPIREETENSMRGALETLPTLDVPPAELLLAVIVGYIILLGPVSYIVLRRIDRRELAWVTAPVLVVLFSAGSYGIGRTLKGSDVIVNQVSVIRTAGAGSAASVDTYAGIFSPDRSTYDLTVEADALISGLRSLEVLPGQARATFRIEQGEPAHLRDLGIGVFGFQGIRAAGVIEHEPALSVTWSARDGNVVGTVTNLSDAPLSDVAYVSGSGGEKVGDLAPGASAEFTIPATNFNGSSAADQIYGFGGFDATNEEQRLIALRRQVIDALVGVNSFMPPGVASGRGPYVIGWHDSEGPMPVTVDGVRARRHATSVEVLSVEPALGTGEVTIRPHRVGVAVISTEGDAGPGGAGSVLIGDGSAIFRLSLPLEAAGLVPSEIDIVVGPDPSVLVNDPGSFGGFWPQGYTVEIRNPSTGEWRVLGDLSTQSQFDVDEPATALSPTGVMEVRITGTDAVDPNFGQQGIFVSAGVSGVIGE